MPSGGGLTRRSRRSPIGPTLSCPGPCTSASRATPPTATTSPARRSAGALRRSSSSATSPIDVPQLLVESSRRAMAAAADAFYGHPSAALDVVGITGTNGKTTTAFLLHAVLEAAGRRTGLLGTVEQRVGGRVEPVVRTTPESVDLQARAAADGRRRRRGLRDGGVVARPRARARGRRAVRRRRVHQPDAGPPRLPPRHGALLPRQGAAVRDRPGRDQRRRRVRPPPGGRGRRAGAHLRPRRRRTPTCARTRSRSARAG